MSIALKRARGYDYLPLKKIFLKKSWLVEFIINIKSKQKQ